ncbi:MAG: RibD family protein [Cyanophyceae cyanobacterium]
MLARPHTTVVLAMSADGKIAAQDRSPARFSSPADREHLESQIAQADGVLFGAGTLRAYGTTLPLSNPQLLQLRQQRQQPPQPVQIVCSGAAQLDPQLRFFRQPVPRWLITTAAGAQRWQDRTEFERIITPKLLEQASPELPPQIDWSEALWQLSCLGIRQLVVLGGGELVASLLAQGLLDEFWLTVCPLVLGGAEAPTPVSGEGCLAQAQDLELLSSERIDQEIFLHYRLKR